MIVKLWKATFPLNANRQWKINLTELFLRTYALIPPREPPTTNNRESLKQRSSLPNRGTSDLVGAALTGWLMTSLSLGYRDYRHTVAGATYRNTKSKNLINEKNLGEEPVVKWIRIADRERERERERNPYIHAGAIYPSAGGRVSFLRDRGWGLSRRVVGIVRVRYRSKVTRKKKDREKE